MADERQLVGRFVAGSNDISWYMPGTPKHAFFIGMPQDVAQLTNTSREAVANLGRIHSELQRSHNEHLMALNEIGIQVCELQSSIAEGFSEMSDAIHHLEDSLCLNLSEIKWVLGQIDSHLADLVSLIKFSRQTEASELVEDGVRALATGNIDDAEACLLEAVEKKRTSFQGHMNLGFVYLHKNDASSSILHFRKAVDYAPESEGYGATIFALENLARACFAAEDFPSARSFMQRAADLRYRNNSPSLSGRYHLSIYCALSGHVQEALSIVEDLCRTNPIYFAVAASDRDFSSLQDQLLFALNALARSENEKGKSLLASARERFERLMSGFTQENRSHIEREIGILQSALQASHGWLAKQNYRDSYRAVRTCEAISAACARLPEISSARASGVLAEQKARTAQRDCDGAMEEWKREQDKDHSAEKSLEDMKKGTSRTAESIKLLGLRLASLILVVAFVYGCYVCLANPGYRGFGDFPFGNPFPAWGKGIMWAIISAASGSLIAALVSGAAKTMKHSTPASLCRAEAARDEKKKLWYEAEEEARQNRAELNRVESGISTHLEVIEEFRTAPEAGPN